MKKLFAKIKSMIIGGSVSLVTYYSTGAIKSEFMYFKGKRHGQWNWYDKNGTKVKEIMYSKGNKFYPWYR